MPQYVCADCRTNDINVIPTTYGWKVTCRNGHEIFPIPGNVIKIREAKNNEQLEAH